MAAPSECYSALCNIRTTIVEQLRLLGYPVDANDCTHMCITDLVNIYSTYTGRTYTVSDLETFISSTVPTAEWLNKVIECNGQFAICIEVGEGEYDWTLLDEESTLIEHTINADGIYNASDFAADGFSKVVVDTSMQRNLQNKSVVPSSEIQVVTADEAFIGLNTVTVKAVQTENANVAATDEMQIIVPEDGMFFKQVNVEAIQNQSKTTLPTVYDQDIVPDQGYDGLDSVIVKGDVNLIPENIIAGKSIFGVVGVATASPNGKPIEINTEEEMNVRRMAASAETAGTLYRYTGTTGTYVSNAMYVITTEEPYVLAKVENMQLALDKAMLTLNDNVLTWDAVPFAIRYTIHKDGNWLATTTETSYTLTIEDAGIYSLTVVAYCPGYTSSWSNAVVYYVGQTKVVRHNTISFPVGNIRSVAASFNNKAVFSCSTNGSSNDTFIEYDSDFAYTIYDAPALFKAASVTSARMFFVTEDTAYAIDADGVVNTTQLTELSHESYKITDVGRAASIQGHALFMNGSNIYAIDDNLVTATVTTIAHHRRDCTCAVSVGDYALLGGGCKYNYEIEYSYNYDTSDAQGPFYYTDSDLRGLTHLNVIDKDLVYTQIFSYNSVTPTGAYVATASIGGYAMFVGGRKRDVTETQYYIVHNQDEGAVLTTVSSEISDTAYGLTDVIAYDRDLVYASDVAQLPHGKYDIASTELPGYAIFAGGRGQTEDFATVHTYNSELAMISADDLITARGGIAAATIGQYAIVAGGGSVTSSEADVYTVQVVYE